MEKVSMVFRKKDCMGCHACEVACKQEHRSNTYLCIFVASATKEA